ncbi:cyclin-dependent kinase inhibitor 3 [Perca flavescens]|uniref:cyclin-dependent kinase inhibitor 3 n=1 Tax=Perca flavescens TaxID=8167 RepID=UPI00106E46B3|nr:cyclin-dependent kinase inhibitor 3 [Perca flavescens]
MTYVAPASSPSAKELASQPKSSALQGKWLQEPRSLLISLLTEGRVKFDSSSEEEVEEEQLTPFHISWLPLSIVECSQFLGICALPGCKYKDIRRSLEKDVDELQNQGVQEVFVFCTRGELNKYRVPSLLEVYRQRGFTVHHTPFPDGDVPELEQCCHILRKLHVSLENNRRTVIHCYGGLGRSGLVAACLLLQLSLTMTANKAIEILREHRGGGAIQTVKQYNFLHEFRERYKAYQDSGEVCTERSLSR